MIACFVFVVRRFFKDKHTIVAHVNPELKETVQYQGVINFLRHSRIFTAITPRPVIIHSYIADFWQYAVFDGAVNPLVIISRINRIPTTISVQDIREALGFGDDEEDPISVPSVTICGVFERMGY